MSATTTEVDAPRRGARVARIAARQHGLITFAQLRRLSGSRGTIQHWTTCGRLHRVHVGVFAVGHRALTDRSRLLAAVMACGPDAALSHTHAALVWRLFPPWVTVNPSPTHVTVPHTSGRGRRPGILVHRAELLPGETELEEGIRVTTVARTALDYGEIASHRELELLVDRAIVEDRVEVGELRTAVAAHPSRRGSGALQRLLDAAERFDSVGDSALEEAFLQLTRAASLPRPSMGAMIGGMKLDAVWPGPRVAVELDGYRWHPTRGRQESDRDREARLRRLGWLVIRYSARQVFERPLEVAADLARVLATRRT